MQSSVRNFCLKTENWLESTESNFIKSINKIVAPYMAYFIHKSFRDSFFPGALKFAVVKALHKGGSKTYI